jgi:Phage tail lysozyme
MILLDQDWTEEQAQGLLDALNLDGGTPQWKSQHLKRLRDWCSAHGKHWETLDGQLAFVAHELCSGFQGIGRALQRSRTAEEARKVVKPYVDRLSASEMEGLADIASRVRA